MYIYDVANIMFFDFFKSVKFPFDKFNILCRI